MFDKEYLTSILSRLNINIDSDQEAKFIRYYELLVEWNEKFNLTAITDAKEVALKHFADSAALMTVKGFENLGDKHVIDVGSGAGFPGVPLKILNPDIHLVMVDSLNKRVNFLNNLIQELGLTNCAAIHARTEELAHETDYREAFDLCVSRAVSNMSTLSEYCLGFVKVGGVFVAYKSVNADTEINESKNAVTTMGGSLKGIFETTIEDDLNRFFVVIDKDSHTPDKYPRANGKPSKSPLK